VIRGAQDDTASEPGRHGRDLRARMRLTNHRVQWLAELVLEQRDDQRGRASRRSSVRARRKVIAVPPPVRSGSRREEARNRPRRISRCERQAARYWQSAPTAATAALRALAGRRRAMPHGARRNRARASCTVLRAVDRTAQIGVGTMRDRCRCNRALADEPRSITGGRPLASAAGHSRRGMLASRTGPT
jgi:hypothetical protein